MSERSEYFDWPDQLAAIQSASAKLRAASDAAARAKLSEPIRKLMLKTELTQADAWAALEMMRAIFWNQKDREYLDAVREALQRSFVLGPFEVHEGAAPDMGVVTSGHAVSEAVDVVCQVAEVFAQSTKGQTPNKCDTVGGITANRQTNAHGRIDTKLDFSCSQLPHSIGMGFAIQHLNAWSAHFATPTESAFGHFEGHRPVSCLIPTAPDKGESVACDSLCVTDKEVIQ